MAPAARRGPRARRERAVVLLNGLGTIKYEELFVLFGTWRPAWRRPASRSPSGVR